ncbi:hypothetical protein LCGC14_1894320 [marine sediment metagenome]|uniref:Uncharacterized protein n=1 Tax=marine sediment metagenome TaxID=412755 RepID=A0A0F9IWL1_9ZZZZ
MNEKKYKEKLLELLMELSKAKKREVGFVEAKTIVRDGLSILGLDANDILGFAKAPNERKIRRVRGSQAWFKKMYEGGWKYAGNFEYEGLINNGFIVMERELPNLTLNAIREELEAILKEDEESYIHVPNPDLMRIAPGFYQKKESLPGMIAVPGSLKIVSKDIPDSVKAVRDPYLKEIMKIVGEDVKIIPKAVKEPKEGFESEVNDFMIDAKTEMKTLEELFFEGTGKNAVWRGNETKAFKEWKKDLDNGN